MTLRSRGLALRVWELHRGAGADVEPPVICLHGWLDQGLAFARVAQGRSGRWLALDQRGHGGSGHAESGGYYHFPDYLADLDALVHTLGTRVTLVGHSMGGTVATMYAGACPDRVHRLVAIEGLGALPVSESSMLKRTRQFLAQLRAPPPAIRVGSIEEAALRLQSRHPGLKASHAVLLAEHGTRETEDGGLSWSFDPLHLTRAPYPFREEAYMEFLAAVTAPTLIVWGSDGWYPSDIQARRTSALRRAREITLEGGHMLPYEAPEALGQLIEHFLFEDDRPLRSIPPQPAT